MITIEKKGQYIELPTISPPVTVKEILEKLGLPEFKKIIAVKVITVKGNKGEIIDLQTPIIGAPITGDSEGAIQLALLAPEDKEALDVLRHSTSHVMAQAVKELYPESQLAIGPAIENGFYYDIDSPLTFSIDDLVKIEARMRDIIAKNKSFERHTMNREEAIAFFKDRGEYYKVELISDMPYQEVSLYKQGEFWDLCAGPHLPATGHIKAFKLLSVAGAYWRGNEKNKMLQRIYGTAFFNKEELDEHLRKLEEAQNRDHRKLGKELSLFSVHEEIGGGLIHWHPKGAMIRHLLENEWKELHLQNGYELVYTPHVASEEIYKISGHLENYQDLMYSSMDIEGKPFRMKPMNCPGHIMIYKSSLHSYRDLPIRFAELGTVYRFERSGVLHGLMRVRGFTIDDAHIFARPDQLQEEIANTINFGLNFLRSFGFSEFEIYLATKPEKAVGSDVEWGRAVNALKAALEKNNLSYQIDEGGGAFYGPKIDLKIKDCLGRLWQCTTIQFDFNLPERFQLTYVTEENKRERPIMVHRALLGSIERFMGVLIEHYAGAFPLWLAPEQIRVMPISDRHISYTNEVREVLVKTGARVSIDMRKEKTGYKIREAQKEKIPYMLIVGDREEEVRAVSVRERKKGDLGSISLLEFVEKISKEIRERYLGP